MCECESSAIETDETEQQPIFSSYQRYKKENMWINRLAEPPKVLDPDDRLMKRFQDALKEHLTRVDQKLTEEVNELEASIREATRVREKEALLLYDSQQEVIRQQTSISKYETSLSNVITLRKEAEESVEHSKKSRREVLNKLESEKSRESKLLRELESLNSLEKQFSEWEKELNSCLAVSQRMSEKDFALQREIVTRKQQEDYVLYKLMMEVWKIQSEISTLDEQLQVKDKERLVASQTIADANADLEALEREQKNLFNAWNGVLVNIGQRDRVNNELSAERSKIRESFTSLQAQMEKLKTETAKEMENNERLTTIQMRINEDAQNTMRVISVDKDKLCSLESQLTKVTHFLERVEKEHDLASTELQRLINEEELINKEMSKWCKQKNDLEDQILLKLNDKVAQDKTLKHLNKVLAETRSAMKEEELTMIQSENTYGKNLLEVERLSCLIEDLKSDLEEFIKRNNEKEKEIDEIRNNVKKLETTIAKKQKQVELLNKQIEEILSSTGGETTSPLDLKILALEKNIDETENKNEKSQQVWLRHESHMVSLTEQRNAQLQDLNLLNKQIALMEQKNVKLDFELEKERKEEANLNRRINLLRQKLMQLNHRLATQREIQDELENKNCFTVNEYNISLEEAERDLIKLQNDIRLLHQEKASLDEQLINAQRESLSWEKRVQLAQETAKTIKSERGSGGDVATMKSEIHKMEIRLSHLRKVQEKLIQDMEFCVSRRESIMEKVVAMEKRNPRTKVNKRVIFRKRLDDQKLKIKQMNKDTKQLENRISNLCENQKETSELLSNVRAKLKEIEEELPEIIKQISEAELVKFHNLEILVHKQRKFKLYQDIKNRRYRMLFKTETSLHEELQKQRIVNVHLKNIMEQTMEDFPLLRDSIRRILMILETS